MKLPIAVQNALEESERLFEETIGRLGLSRGELAELAVRIRNNHPAAPDPGRARAVRKEKLSCWRTM